jgi:guanylate kinase|tara:strand:+ start:121 stop:705 length:585 start_codon:yes stop_codon:yes gene_type:complete
MTKRDESILLILSSPSGAGKTTISKKIQQKFQNFKISVSHTTREPRTNEINGIDYLFIDRDKFKQKIKNKDFYEHAKIFDNYYGTSRESIKKLTKQNHDILFDIDWQGTQQLSKYKELNLIKIFILPPNKKELEKRLYERNQDTKKTVVNRLKCFEEDSLHWNEYDYVIINDNLENCFSQIESIITLHKTKTDL